MPNYVRQCNNNASLSFPPLSKFCRIYGYRCRYLRNVGDGARWAAQAKLVQLLDIGAQLCAQFVQRFVFAHVV